MNRAEDAPHYTLDVSEHWLDSGKIINLDDRPIYDPFIRTTVRPCGWRAALAVLLGRWECIVKVGGDREAHRAVFNSDYTPLPAEPPTFATPEDSRASFGLSPRQPKRWRPRLSVVLVGFILAGCSLSPIREARTITLTVERARSIHATAKTLYKTLYDRLAPLCVGGESSSGLPLQLGQPLAPDCLKMARVHHEFQRVNFEIQRALDNPGVELDEERLEDLLRLIVDLAVP